jgi:hypothetical protein
MRAVFFASALGFTILASACAPSPDRSFADPPAPDTGPPPDSGTPRDGGPGASADAEGGGASADAEGGSSSGGMSGCHVANSDCPAGTYCASTDCRGGSGACTPLPLDATSYVPVCGCDKVSYWNAITAAKFGAAVAAAGPCDSAGGNLECDSQNLCPVAGQICALDLSALTQYTMCKGIDLGVCWGVPDQCPPTPRALSCGISGQAGGCMSLCDALAQYSSPANAQGGGPYPVEFYQSTTCP